MANTKEIDKAQKLIECKEILQQAIDEREELKNELCLHCGKYKNEHLGACKGCKWYEWCYWTRKKNRILRKRS